MTTILPLFLFGRTDLTRNQTLFCRLGRDEPSRTSLYRVHLSVQGEHRVLSCIYNPEIFHHCIEFIYNLIYNVSNTICNRKRQILVRWINFFSSSFFSAGQHFQPHRRASMGGLEWAVESTTVTHSNADWWDILLPLA